MCSLPRHHDLPYLLTLFIIFTIAHLIISGGAGLIAVNPDRAMPLVNLIAIALSGVFIGLVQLGLVGDPGSLSFLVGFVLNAMVYSAVASLIIWRIARIRTTPGKCWGCGYDLRGGRRGQCPECGTWYGWPE